MRQLSHLFQNMDDRRKAMILIFAFFILKIAASPFQSLSGDESYGVVLGRNLEMSYFDHPPLHQWIAHFSTLVFGESEWARIPFILLFAFASWFIFLSTEIAFSARAGLIAVFCLNASWDMLTGAGTRILPSNPLMFSFALTLWALSRITLAKPSPQQSYALWLVLGFALGLSALSKYHAIFVGFGILIFFALSPRQRHWFRHPAPYLGAVFALIVLSPVVLWNWQNDWASFRFQGSRLQQSLSDNAIALQISDLAVQLNPFAPLEIIWALVGKLTPWIFIPLALAVINAIRHHRKEDRYLIFFCTGLPIITWFVFAPIFGTAIGHSWSLPGVFFLFPLLGNWLFEKNVDWKISFSKIGSTIIALSITIIVVMGTNDRTGWIAAKVPYMQDAAPRFTLGQSFRNLAETELRQDVDNMHAAFVITRMSYSASAKVSIALGSDVPLLSQTDPRGLFFTLDQSDWIGKSGILVTQEENLDSVIQAISPYFESYDAPRRVEIAHTLWTSKTFALIRVYQLKKPFPFVSTRMRSLN